MVALIIALIGQVLMTSRPPSKSRTYGFGRAEVLAALFNSAALLAITGLGRRRGHRPVSAIRPDIAAGPLLLVGVLGIAVNGLSAW